MENIEMEANLKIQQGGQKPENGGGDSRGALRGKRCERLKNGRRH